MPSGNQWSWVFVDTNLKEGKKKDPQDYGTNGWGVEARLWYHQYIACVKSSQRTSISPVWTRMRIQSKQIYRVSDYSPSKNKTPREDATHTNRNIYQNGGYFSCLTIYEGVLWWVLHKNTYIQQGDRPQWGLLI